MAQFERWFILIQHKCSQIFDDDNDGDDDVSHSGQATSLQSFCGWNKAEIIYIQRSCLSTFFLVYIVCSPNVETENAMWPFAYI